MSKVPPEPLAEWGTTENVWTSTASRVMVAIGLAALVIGTVVFVVGSQCRWGTFVYMVSTGDPSNQEDWRRDAVVMVEDEERFITDDRAAWDVALSPDGSRVVVAKAVGGTESEYDTPKMKGLYVYDVDGSNEVQLGVVGAQPDWSPNGEKIAFTSGGIVKVVDVNNRKEWEVFRLPPSTAVDKPYLNGIAWSADSTKLAVAVGHQDGSTIWAVKRDGSDRSKLLTVDDSLVHDLEWSPDGALAWSGRYRGVASVLIAERSGEIMQVEPNSSSPAWSRDGNRLAYVIGHEGHYAPRIVIGDERGQGEEPVPMPERARGRVVEDWASC